METGRSYLGNVLGFLIAGTSLLGCMSCAVNEPRSSELLWKQTFYRIGSQSSIRVADLNQDGVQDVVFGAGLEELGRVEQGIIALNGLDGSELWSYPAPAQVVGSATFLDINGDRSPEVIIGGRKQFLVCLNGMDGQLIWQYEIGDSTHPVLSKAKYNFYSSVLIPDQNEDGIQELLLVNGGNWSAPPNDMQIREAGVLMIMNPATGDILAADTMPDGMETYMTPLWIPARNGQSDRLIFGSGGETASGNLYHIELSTFLSEGLALADVLIGEEGHGFIAPPSLADLNGDGIPDILAISHAGTLTAINGQTLQTIWQQRNQGLETSNSLALGQFTGNDQVPDIISVLSEGIWPDYTHAHLVLTNGRTGEVEWRDTLGCWTLSSPIILDLNQDDRDEIILSVNRFDCLTPKVDDAVNPSFIAHELLALDVTTRQTQTIYRETGFRNQFSTPWIGDLSGDGYLDIVFPQYFHGNNLFKFLGMNVLAIQLPIKNQEDVKWGAYLGSQYNGIYPID